MKRSSKRIGKMLALLVNKNANYKILLEKATVKWQDFHANLYEEGAEYVLLLEDGQEALFLPGSCKEFFTLNRYKEEILKDFKRITLFLCTSDDLSMSRKSDEEESQSDNSEVPAKKGATTLTWMPLKMRSR
jgi:hypothetical protein